MFFDLEANSEEICAEELFNLGKPAARTDYELQRVLQVQRDFIVVSCFDLNESINRHMKWIEFKQ